MNKIQENFCKIINQYVKETYPNDATLKYLLDGIDNFTDNNIQTEVDRKPNISGLIPESIFNEKERIKEIMNKILDVNFKPTTFHFSSGQIKKTEPINTEDGNPNLIDETLTEINKIPKEDISKHFTKDTIE